MEIPFSTVVPHKKIMEETANCGTAGEYRRIHLRLIARITCRVQASFIL